MSLESWLNSLGDEPRPDSFGQLQSELGLSWVKEALDRTGKQSIRRRVLPNEVVVWLVIGMALFRDRSIEAVVKYLGLPVGPGARRGGPSGSRVGSDTVTKARQRVGWEPLRALFEATAERWSREFADYHLWRGLRLVSIDGSTLRIADSKDNEAVYGRPGSDRSTAAYPQARVLGLLEVGSRIMADFVVGMYQQSEQELVKELWPKLPEQSLVILDRGFVNYGAFAAITAMGGGRHWMCRAKSNVAFTVVEEFGPGDRLVRLTLSSTARRQLPDAPKSIEARLVEYSIEGHGEYRLLTSLVDAAQYSADDIAAQYHERWEIETAFAEKKVQMLDRRETIRSKTPDGVLQEIYGLLIAYNLVRVMMARAAREQGIHPRRMSFRNSLMHVRLFLLSASQVAPGTIPKLYKQLCEDMGLLVLPERRERSFPRVVKIKMSNYKRKALE